MPRNKRNELVAEAPSTLDGRGDAAAPSIDTPVDTDSDMPPSGPSPAEISRAAFFELVTQELNETRSIPPANAVPEGTYLFVVRDAQLILDPEASKALVMVSTRLIADSVGQPSKYADAVLTHPINLLGRGKCSPEMAKGFAVRDLKAFGMHVSPDTPWNEALSDDRLEAMIGTTFIANVRHRNGFANLDRLVGLKPEHQKALSKTITQSNTQAAEEAVA